MPDDGAGIQLTALGATESVDERQLAQFYTYPDDLRSCWVRGNMIASLDGGAADAGKSGGLAGRVARQFQRAHEIQGSIGRGIGGVGAQNGAAIVHAHLAQVFDFAGLEVVGDQMRSG